MTINTEEFRLIPLAFTKSEALRIPGALDDRCGLRHIIKLPATLRKSGDRPFSVIVRDISISGFSCEAVSSMRPGAICWLNLPGLAGLQSEVIRNDGAVIGCAFANLLNSAVLDRIIANAPRELLKDGPRAIPFN